MAGIVPQGAHGTEQQLIIAFGFLKQIENIAPFDQAAAHGALVVHLLLLGRELGVEGLHGVAALLHLRLALGRALLHAVDALGLVHAMLLRIQVAMMPFKTLVFSGGH